MLEWFFLFAIVWICASIVIIATSWYMAVTIQPFVPNWWRRIIADDEPVPDDSFLSSPAERLPDTQPNLQDPSRYRKPFS